MFKQFRALREIYNPYSPYMPYKDRYDIQQQPDINATLGAVDPQEANLEAEKGEVAVKPDLSGIYSIAGRKHSQGGTPLNLQSGSFIFSDDKSLAISKDEKKIFQFKGGGITGKGRNTPARVIKREVDLNKYNSSSNILQDHTFDNISKNAAGLMLQKYIEKMGQVAYVQEAKKGFPSGLPPFSQNTAPTFSNEVDEKLKQNPQYMRSGGYTNPYTSRMMTFAGGGTNGDPEDDDPSIGPGDAYPGGHTPLGRITPTSLPNNFNFPGGVPALIRRWNRVGVDLSNLNPAEAQGAMYDWALKNDPSLLKELWSTYGNTASGSKQGLNYDYRNLSGSQLQDARKSYVDGLLGARTFAPRPQITIPSLAPDRPAVPDITALGNPTLPQASSFNPNPYNPGRTLPYNPSIPLSPLQKANLLYAGYQALTVPKFYPARQQVNSPAVELSRFNPQGALNGVDSSAAAAYEANQLQNPYLAGANNQAIFANALQARNQITSDYDNRNVGVGNQQALTNNQIQRQDLLQNAQLSGRYYDQLTALNRNYADESRFARNQGVSLLNNYLSNNQALEQSLASQQTFGRVQVGKDQNGNPIYQSKPLFDVDTTGISPRVYYTGAGSLNNIPYQSNKLYDFSLFAEEMRRAGIDPNSVTGARYFAALRGSNLQQPYQYQPYNAAPAPYKKGGMFGWMQSMYQNPYAQRGLSR